MARETIITCTGCGNVDETFAKNFKGVLKKSTAEQAAMLKSLGWQMDQEGEFCHKCRKDGGESLTGGDKEILTLSADDVAEMDSVFESATGEGEDVTVRKREDEPEEGSATA